MTILLWKGKQTALPLKVLELLIVGVTENFSYSGLDGNPFKGITYYRLKQTDFDGKFSYPQIVSVNLTKFLNAMVYMNLYPNPAIDHLNIQVSVENINAGIQVEIFNAVGQVVFKKSLGNLYTTGNQVYQVNTAQFSPGFYMVRLMNGGEIIA